MRQWLYCFFSFVLGIWFSNIFRTVSPPPPPQRDVDSLLMTTTTSSSFTQQRCDCPNTNVKTNNGIDQTSSGRSSRSSPLRRSLSEILETANSDKYTRHHYERYYESWFESPLLLNGGGRSSASSSHSYRTKPKLRVLEIGVRDGTSLEVWKEYFGENAELIVGLAYGVETKKLTQHRVKEITSTKTSAGGEGSGNKGSSTNDENKNTPTVEIVWGDQSKLSTMEMLSSTSKGYGNYDIIIDDGSHVPQHMVYTLYSLFDTALNPGGIYIIEDIETNYWKNGTVLFGYNFDETQTTSIMNAYNNKVLREDYSAVTKVQQLQHLLARYQIGAKLLQNEVLMPGDNDICSIEWGMNIVAIKKCPEAGASPASGAGGGRGTSAFYKKPPMQKPMFNEQAMKEWIQNVQRTNPKNILQRTDSNMRIVDGIVHYNDFQTKMRKKKLKKYAG